MNLSLPQFSFKTAFLILTLCFGCGVMSTFGENSSADFAAANTLYDQQKFAEAAMAYQKIADSGTISSSIFFNLGNAHFQSGDMGRAIAAYRRAEKLNPRDADIQTNLRRARDKVQNSGASKGEESFLARLTANEWTVLASIPFALCFLLLAFGQLRRDWQKVTRNYTIALAVVALLLGSLAAIAAQQETHKSAVIVAEEAVVRHGPFNESQSAFTLRAGAELTVLDERETWVQVSAGRNRVGWVQKAQVAWVN